MFINRLHTDERGSISIISVFAVMFLAMLLGMVMNAGRHVDGKIRMQNAADSAAYSGGVVLARGMNSIAFTNHLLCDVFAVTAFLREARDQNAASYSPQILTAWQKVAPVFSAAGFPKFTELGSAIQEKVPVEQRAVDTYSAWAGSVSSQVLPMMEEILADELIPKYQRAVMVAFPEIAQSAARETALRNGDPDHRRGPMLGVLWRSDAKTVGGSSESGYSPDDRTLPVVDPELDTLPNQDEYVHTAQQQRRHLAHRYLNDWNNELLVAFDRLGKMSQFAGLWRSFSCGQLEKLLNDDYPKTNLPFVIRDNPADASNPTAALAKHYTFISVVYWKNLPESLPGLFKNPLDSDAQAFAEVHLFIPRPRLAWCRAGGTPGSGPSLESMGGVPGEIAMVPVDQPPGSESAGSDPSTKWYVGRVGSPTAWNLLNQSWNCQLAPVTQPALATILQSTPDVAGYSSDQYRLPSLGEISSEDLQQISPH